MGDAGSPAARLHRAIENRNLFLVRAAAAELPVVTLGDALRICALIEAAEPDRYDQAAVRLVGRICHERPRLTVDELVLVVLAVRRGADPELRRALARLLRR